MNRKAFFTSLGAAAAWLLFPFRKVAAATINPLQRFKGTKSQFVVTFVEDGENFCAHLRDVSNRNSFQEKTIMIKVDPGSDFTPHFITEKNNMARRYCVCNQLASILHQRVYPNDRLGAEAIYKPGSLKIVEEVVHHSNANGPYTFTHLRSITNPDFKPA